MRKSFIWFEVALLVLWILTLSACGSQETQIGTENATKVEIAGVGKNSPSEELIEEDLKEALKNKNEYATLRSAETVKSLTDDQRYSITLSIVAESKYADWKYEVDMSYTKYDQGWMLDTADIQPIDYSVIRIPNDGEMTEIANSFFTSCEYVRLNSLAGISCGSVNANDGYDTIEFEWINIIQYKHGREEVQYSSVWHYDQEADSWALNKSELSQYGGYEITQIESETEIDSNFNGIWTESGESIEISNFTREKFDVTMDGKTKTFYQSGSPYSQKEAFGWYKDEDDRYIQIQLKENKSVIIMISWSSATSSTLWFSCEIGNELPLL